jgi:hypothetical protein
MTRAYLRLDPGFDEHKAHYPDGPYAALIGCLCLAESQPDRGRFRSQRYLKALLDKRGRHVEYLIAHGDLVLLPDGRLYIEGWDEWQEGDWKVTERVRRIRGRKHGDVSPDVTVSATPDVTVRTESLRDPAPSERSGAVRSEAVHSEALRGALRAREANGAAARDDEYAIQALAEQLVGPNALQNIRSKFGEMAMAQVRKHGLPAVTQAWQTVATATGPSPTIRQIVFSADDLLDPPVRVRVEPPKKRQAKGFLPSDEEVRDAFEHYDD